MTRIKRGLPRKKLASLLGLRDAGSIYRWERGDILPSLENALRLSAFLSMPVEFLFKELRQELLEKLDLGPADGSAKAAGREDPIVATTPLGSIRVDTMR
jgi:transcriptional regulator with XRE-family HTH domain